MSAPAGIVHSLSALCPMDTTGFSSLVVTKIAFLDSRGLPILYCSVWLLWSLSFDIGLIPYELHREEFSLSLAPFTGSISKGGDVDHTLPCEPRHLRSERSTPTTRVYKRAPRNTDHRRCYRGTEAVNVRLGSRTSHGPSPIRHCSRFQRITKSSAMRRRQRCPWLCRYPIHGCSRDPSEA